VLPELKINLIMVGILMMMSTAIIQNTTHFIEATVFPYITLDFLFLVIFTFWPTDMDMVDSGLNIISS
jgi:hypothetical protein